MDIRKRLAQELHTTIGRLQQAGVVTGASSAETVAVADPMDEIQRSMEREVGFATRSLLITRANRLASALERLGRGDYGICEECGGAIAPARLAALPEVTTCVVCQDRREREDPRDQSREVAGATLTLGEDD